MKKFVAAIICLLLWTAPVMAENAESVNPENERNPANMTAKENVPAEKETPHGVFMDPIVTGMRTVTGFGAPNANITIYDATSVVMGKGTSDGNGRFQITLTRAIRIGDVLVAKDDHNGEFKAPAETLATMERRAYVSGHRHYMNPNVVVSRAEVAMMVARIETGKTTLRGIKKSGFRDASGGWYTTAVDYVSRKGILRGYPDNTFHPNRGMTRAEFASMLCRFAPAAKATGHPFRDSYGHWASRSIGRAYNSGWISGYGDGKFHPNRHVTRAEAVAMLNRAMGRKTTAASFRETTHMDRMVSFIDVRPNHWAYYDLLDGANTHRVMEKQNRKAVDRWVQVGK
ncbi:hypothetical protein PEPCOX59622_01504 [Aedoeadaptatus coxii]|uniref:S-layer homology domain-containing protein n=1 Tax=Aedoeadaptatus coxii TaxID=755172 RepID=UPI0017581B7D|nr:S-layer homology domain-containing protein [Peptoniphilus coxii]CAC9934415.1 hypothetical protein PEPCOX59622_01504 [Peptoniphilus coxii]